MRSVGPNCWGKVGPVSALLDPDFGGFSLMSIRVPGGRRVVQQVGKNRVTRDRGPSDALPPPGSACVLAPKPRRRCRAAVTQAELRGKESHLPHTHYLRSAAGAFSFFSPLPAHRNAKNRNFRHIALFFCFFAEAASESGRRRAFSLRLYDEGAAWNKGREEDSSWSEGNSL